MDKFLVESYAYTNHKQQITTYQNILTVLQMKFTFLEQKL